jgi:hypothetical protein
VIARRVVLLAAMALAACSSESEDCGTPADVSGNWDYSATQSVPAATIAGNWVISQPETCRIGGTFSATVDEGDGTPGLLSGTVSGIFLDETHVEVHLYPAGSGDRVHLGTLVADTISGSWEQPGAGAGVSGSFRLEREAP